MNEVTIANTPLPVTVGNFPATPNPIPSGSTVTRQAVNATPSVVLSPNAARKTLIIAVEGTVPLYVLFATDVTTAANVSATNYSKQILNPMDDLEIAFTGAVGVVNPSNAGGSIQVTELA